MIGDSDQSMSVFQWFGVMETRLVGHTLRLVRWGMEKELDMVKQKRGRVARQ